MNMIDQNKNIIDQRRSLSLQIGIGKLNGRNLTEPDMKYNENSVKFSGKS